MDNPADYEADILLWSEKQAQVIRGMAGRVRDLPNDLDIENIAEEIESVGRSELYAAKSQMRLLLVHLIKMAAAPEDAFPQRHWLSEALSFHGNLPDILTPSMPAKMDIQRIWQQAVLEARNAFHKSNRELPDVPKGCPFILTQVLNEDFDLRAAADLLRAEIAHLSPKSE